MNPMAQGKSLLQFEASSENKIFTDAVQNLPGFFDTNLVDSGRVVKGFYKDPQANIRVFYYQYLKLCFELENVDYEFYIRKIEEIINSPDFEIEFEKDDDPEIFNDPQFKRFILQFFGLLNEHPMPIQQALNRFPIMDVVFIYFFRTILILSNQADSIHCYLDRDKLMQFLANYFDVEVALHDRCLKFVETDIFVLEESPEEVYMAYINYEDSEQFRSANNSSRKQESMQYKSGEDYEQSLSNPYTNNLYAPQNDAPKQTVVISSPLNQSSGSPATDSNQVNQSQSNHYQANQYQSSVTNQTNQYQANQTSLSMNKNTIVKESYIASEFMDYTSSNPQGGLGVDLSSMARGGGRKQSGFFNEEREEEKVPEKIEGYQKGNKIEAFKEMTKTEYTSGLTNKMESYQDKKYETSYQPWEKESKNTYESYQPPLELSKPTLSGSNQFGGIENTGYNLKTEKTYADIMSYAPRAESNYSNEPKMTKGGIGTMVVGGISGSNGFSGVAGVAASGAGMNSGIGHKFNLNITQQFTNSVILKSMIEPYRGNIQNIKSRARAYRKSIQTHF